MSPHAKFPLKKSNTWHWQPRNFLSLRLNLYLQVVSLLSWWRARLCGQESLMLISCTWSGRIWEIWYRDTCRYSKPMSSSAGWAFLTLELLNLWNINYPKIWEVMEWTLHWGIVKIFIINILVRKPSYYFIYHVSVPLEIRAIWRFKLELIIFFSPDVWTRIRPEDGVVSSCCLTTTSRTSHSRCRTLRRSWGGGGMVDTTAEACCCHTSPTTGALRMGHQISGGLNLNISCFFSIFKMSTL